MTGFGCSNEATENYLTVNDIGAVESRVCDVLAGLLHVFVKVPTSVLIKHSKYQAPFFIWAQLHSAADSAKETHGIILVVQVGENIH